jgi:kynureninase
MQKIGLYQAKLQHCLAMTYENTRTFAQHLDEIDPLRAFRDQFYVPKHADNELIYLCGNSLGLQPKTVRQAINQELDVWQNLGVEGWFETLPGADNAETWLGYHRRCQAPLAQIVGAKPAEVCPMNALTVNLHLLLMSFYQPTPTRHKILTIAGDFPSDQYALETHVRQRGYDPATAIVEVRPGSDGLISTDFIAEALHSHDNELAMVWMSGLNYYTGQCYNMAEITQLAHRQGILVGFDLAHAIGNVPLQLHDWGVDCATWCSYKYLNGGPGAVSGVFVHEKHHTPTENGDFLPRLAGWWGYDESRRFGMKPGFVPEPGAAGWQLSTPNILALATHQAAINITAEAGMAAIRQKSERLTCFLAFVLCGIPAIKILTPTDPTQRGAQLSLLVHENGKALFNHLTAQGIIGDWREPDCIRLAPAPLYNTFEEVWRVGQELRNKVNIPS